MTPPSPATTPPKPSHPITVISFGYRHPGLPPVADITVDARRVLRNPHNDPAMRELTGLDAVVRAHVLATPGAVRLIRRSAICAYELACDTGLPVTVATGCAGGRHRAPALAEEITALLVMLGADAVVIHRDVTRPLLPLSATTVA